MLGKKSFVQRREAALSIFHKVKKDLTSLNSDISTRRKTIAKEITKLSAEDTELIGVELANTATLVDVNSVLGIDPVKESMENKK